MVKIQLADHNYFCPFYFLFWPGAALTPQKNFYTETFRDLHELECLYINVVESDGWKEPKTESYDRDSGWN